MARKRTSQVIVNRNGHGLRRNNQANGLQHMKKNMMERYPSSIAVFGDSFGKLGLLQVCPDRVLFHAKLQILCSSGSESRLRTSNFDRRMGEEGVKRWEKGSWLRENF